MYFRCFHLRFYFSTFSYVTKKNHRCSLTSHHALLALPFAKFPSFQNRLQNNGVESGVSFQKFHISIELIVLVAWNSVNLVVHRIYSSNSPLNLLATRIEVSMCRVGLCSEISINLSNRHLLVVFDYYDLNCWILSKYYIIETKMDSTSLVHVLEKITSSGELMFSFYQLPVKCYHLLNTLISCWNFR